MTTVRNNDVSSINTALIQMMDAINNNTSSSSTSITKKSNDNGIVITFTAISLKIMLLTVTISGNSSVTTVQLPGSFTTLTYKVATCKYGTEDYSTYTPQVITKKKNYFTVSYGRGAESSSVSDERTFDFIIIGF